MSEEKRIYVVLPKTVRAKTIDMQFIGGSWFDFGYEKDIEQVAGRQIAQACHVVSKLRHELLQANAGETHNKIGCAAMSQFLQQDFEPVTTIILECRNSKELKHLFTALTGDGKQPTLFQDENPAVYGHTKPITALAVYALSSEVENTLGYLPLWGAK